MNVNLYSFKKSSSLHYSVAIVINKINPKYILCTDCSDCIKNKYQGTRVIYNVISIIFALHILV